MNRPKSQKIQLNQTSQKAFTRELSSVVLSKEEIEELRKILDEEYRRPISYRAVERIATFLVQYAKILKKLDANSKDD